MTPDIPGPREVAPTSEGESTLLGGDLLWWRGRPGERTVIAIRPTVEQQNAMPAGSLPEVALCVRLHGKQGQQLAEWHTTLTDRDLYIDSDHPPSALAEASATEGVLAILVSAPSAIDAAARDDYARLFAMVDWFFADGTMVSLHSDQALDAREGPMELTEVVEVETPVRSTSLVYLNGPIAQPANSLTLAVRNHRGEVRHGTYQPAMAPYSLHRVELAKVFDGLIEHGAGQPISVSGRFAARGLFTRPYVITRGTVSGGYHAGNRYRRHGLPSVVHRALGCGETNPMLVVHNQSVTTTVNLLHSHGDIEDDFWVDARLYDRDGVLVCDRPRWLLARRHRHARADISDLLPATSAPFVGHISLSFSVAEDAAFYPVHVQGLFEYRTEHSVSRVMTWSDFWNVQPQLAKLQRDLGPLYGLVEHHVSPALRPAPLVLECDYRAWHKPPLMSRIAISNCGPPDHSAHADYQLSLRTRDGGVHTAHDTLPPFATHYRSLAEYFPDVDQLLAPHGIGMATVSSTADLAVVQLTENQQTGRISVEHFVARPAYTPDGYYDPCGA